MAEVIARVGKITGEAFARDPDGNVRRLKSGDPIREGDVVQTAEGGQVQLTLADGRDLLVGANEVAKIDAEVAAPDLPNAGDSAVQNNPRGFIKVAKAIVGPDGTFSFDDDGGQVKASVDQKDGHTFIELVRIVENVDPLAFQFSTTRFPLTGTIQGGATTQVLASAGLQLAAALDAASDSGAKGDALTNDAKPTISGTATPGAFITVVSPTGEVLTTTVPESGIWSVTPTIPLASGPATFRVGAVDGFGNAVQTTVGATIDMATTLSAELAPASDSGTAGDNLTNDATPTIRGTGEPGATITVTSPTGEVLTTTVAANGTWSVTPAVALPDGPAAFAVMATDAAGNTRNATVSLVVDTVAVASITVNNVTADNVINAAESGQTIAVTGTAGGDSKAGDTVTLVVNGNTYTGTLTAGLTYSIAVPGSDLAVDATIDASVVVTDAAGNTATGATTHTHAIDTVAAAAPTVVITEDTNNDGRLSLAEINGQADVRVTLPSGAVAGDTLTVTDGTVTTVIVLSVAQISVGFVDTSFPQPADGSTLTVTATITDQAGNVSLPGSDVASRDSTPPTATITLSDNALKIGETSTVTVTFSEAVTGFDASDLTVVNGTLGAMTSTDGGITWTGTFTPSTNVEDTTNIVSLASTYTDAAGNTGTTATSGNYAVDTKAPTATITLSDNALKIGETSTVTVTFSEAVTGFDASDLTVVNGTLGAMTSTDGGITWTGTFTPSTNVEDTTNIVSLASTYTDAAGNTGTTATSGNYAVDTKAPTATITLSDNALKIGETSTVTVTFSEAVTGFDASDLTVVNGTLGAMTSTDGGITWTGTFTPSTNVEDTTNIVSLASTYTDAAGNTGTTATSGNYAVDTKAPTATITLSDNALKIGETSTVTVTFSEAVTGFDASDLTVVNGTLGAMTSTDGGITWTGTFTPSTNVEDTTNIVSLASTYTDAAGNTGTTATSGNYAVDTKAPTATITLSDNALKIGETSTVTVTFSEAVTGFDASDLTVVNGTLGAMTSTDGGITWTGTFTPSTNVEDTTNIVSLASTYTDAAGNTGTTATSGNYAVDTKAPTATITLSDNALKIGETSTVTVTFSEAVTGFDASDLTVVNGTLGAMTSTDGGITWTGTFTPSTNVEDTTNIVSLASTYTDAAGNTGTTATSGNYAVDTKAPTATITLSDNALKIGETSTVTVTFSEAVTGFDASDLTVVNGTLGAMTSTDGGITWTGTFTPSTNVEDTTNIVSLASTYTDAAGNTGTTATSGNYAVDTKAPTATITLSDNALKIGETSTVTVTFSEAVTGFDASDLTVVNGTLGAMTSTDGGITWTGTFTPSTNVEDTTNIVSLASTYTDAAGNTGTTATSGNYAVDTKAPTATITLSDNALKIGETSTVTVTFSEAVTGFDASDLTVVNGTLGAMTSTDGGITWTGTFTPSTNVEDTTNIVSLASTYTDAAGNTGTTATSGNYAVDTKAPTATITLSDNALKIGETSTVTVTFSEAVTGFDASDLTVVNGTLGAMTSTDGGITWTGTFTPSTNVEDTTNIVSLASTYTDAAGNTGTTATSGNYAVDTKAPTATITLSDNALKIGETSTVTVTFSEAVTGFDASDLTVVNGTLGAMTSTDGGITWTGTFTPSTNVEDTTNIVSLASTYTDAAGNTGTTATSGNYAVDTKAPVVTVNIVAGNLNEDGGTSSVTFTFSEAPVGFDFGDITVVGGTLSGFAGSGTSYSAVFTPTPNFNGTASVSVVAGTYTDAAGNPGGAGSDTITINSVNDAPVANDDAPATALTEDAAITTLSGNVISGGSGNVADTDPDGTTPSVIGIVFGTPGTPPSGGVGAVINGVYGTLTLSALGAYTYTLDNSRAATKNLVAGQQVTEVFTYTVSDGILSDTATLTVRVNGAGDTTGGTPQVVSVTATGLNGEYYGYNDSGGGAARTHPDDGTVGNLESVEDLQAIINGRNALAGGANNIVGTSTAASTGAADVRFGAKDVDYVMTGADLGQNNVVASGGAISAGTGELATFLSSNSNDRASAVAEAGLGDTTDAAIRLTGKIFFERGNYDFRVVADDGFRLKLAGRTLLEFDANQAPTTRVFSNVEIDDLIEGLQPFELLYWEQGGNAVLKIEYKLSSSSTWNVLNTDNVAMFSNQSAPTISDTRVQDLVAAGSGNFNVRTGSILDGTTAAETLTGNTARDWLRGFGGNDTLRGGGGADLLEGGDGDDRLEGEVGNDILDGGTGNDTMIGGAGDDFYFVDSVADVVTESANAGTDTIRLAATYNPASVDLASYANVENVTVLGTGNVSVTGTGAANRLVGGDGNNTLSGGAGQDYLSGGKGNDTLTGGNDRDTFAWSLADRGSPGTPAIDRITDFNTGVFSNVDGATSTGDRLDLRDLLQGEWSNLVPNVGNLRNFIDVERSGSDTILHISSTGQFNASNTSSSTVGTNTSAVEDLRIVLEGVNLTSGATTDQAVIQNLLQNGKLIVD